MSRFEQLARTIQNNQVHCAAVLSSTNQMIDLYRKGVSFEFNIQSNNIPINTIENDGTMCTSYPQPVTAVTDALTRNVGNMKRKRSRIEYHNNIQSSQPLSQTIGNNDSNCLPPPKKATRRCVICTTLGCGGQFKCNRLALYGNLP